MRFSAILRYAIAGFYCTYESRLSGRQEKVDHFGGKNQCNHACKMTTSLLLPRNCLNRVFLSYEKRNGKNLIPKYETILTFEI